MFGQQQQQSGTTGLFGPPLQQQQASNMFGGTTQNTGQGLFGGNTQNTGTPTLNLFGTSTTQNTGTGGGFGQSTTGQQPGLSLFGGQQQTQPSGGLFGTQSQQPQQQQQPGGMFGSLLGQPQQQQQQTPFGGLGGSVVGQQTQMQVSQVNASAVVEKMQRVKNSWDPSHPDYAFRAYFYNHVGKERASQYQKPANEDVQAYEKAWDERPNDSCVPVQANGFNDLEQRVKSQEAQVNHFRVALHNIQNQLEAIQNTHDLHTSSKLEDCRRRHVALSKRALSLAAKVQVLRNRGYALQPEEEELKKRLEGLARQVTDPAATGRMNEIWARMQVVMERARVMEESLSKVEIVWDEKQLQTAGKLLTSNAAGLEYLHKEVRDIEKTFAEWEQQHKSRQPF
ncbi:hypothetical protein EX30DRAFT_317311 [Ascodesmis nigricans]|uniref:Nucleoporin Nup54 alpha-helical domain-containing protein n=1 Tax=Ascodesmis nigricans TaxID=341454 RepID=A0A4S2N262_9PEZI|nr:hypothetical protein EX30DRAFT_317311 [Ascodesmis nigricans]